MKVVINDANILIDLVELDLLETFSQLDFELYITDFVVNEINNYQKKAIQKLNTNQQLAILETTEVSDYQAIQQLLDTNNGLSFEDCSVWHYSQKLKGILLTGDGKLRKQALKSGLEVRGIIYIFDELVKAQLLSYLDAANKMESLVQLNNRLPKKEIEKRIKAWRNNKPIE
jgi:rRNA-processing protein FCF1